MQRGFTLIEIVVVILLIGIITAMGLPRFLRSGQTPTEEFIGRLNNLVGDGVEPLCVPEQCSASFSILMPRR